MSEDGQTGAGLVRLPREYADWLAKPFAKFLGIEAAAGAVLLLFTLAALLLSNSPWAHLYSSAWETEIGLHIGSLEFARSLRHWINDGLLTPARRWVSDERLYAILDQVVAHPAGDDASGDTRDRETLQAAEIAARETLSPVERLEFALHPWVGFVIMPLFAFANAGLPLSFSDIGSSVTLAVFLGFVVGKPVGILTFSWLAVRSGIAIRPPDLDWKLLAGGGLLAGIGFTMALFIANLAFSASLIDSAKLGIFLASAVSAVAGLALLRSSPRRAAHAGTARH